jgi:predicted transcriptional regulator
VIAGVVRFVAANSPAFASAERHSVWIELRREGHLEKEIGSRYGVTQQAVSKGLLKYVRDPPAGEAERLRRMHAAAGYLNRFRRDR